MNNWKRSLTLWWYKVQGAHWWVFEGTWVLFHPVTMAAKYRELQYDHECIFSENEYLKEELGLVDNISEDDE